MRLMKTVRLGAVAVAAAAGLGLAVAPAHASTTTLHKVECNQSDKSQLQFWQIVTPWPQTCFAGHGDLNVSLSQFALTPGNNTGYLVYRDGTKKTFTAGEPKFGLKGEVIHIHVN
ncbi:hypothetical protein [Streptomyces sp. NPDC049585]|uniref:hypothetical protein n=1 Tax=Streptomyces sp. NPDC049585 TaxID=3155154 RepID=UPI00342DA548